MDAPTPPELAAALDRLSSILDAAERKHIDLEVAPWNEVEAGVIKVLGGSFRPDQPEHQLVALGLAAAFGHRLVREEGAFWFVNRDAPEGYGLGFPDAMIMLSPFGAVAESLARAKLATLDDITKDIRAALGRAKFSVTNPSNRAVRLTPDEYQRLFDPGFIQLISIDMVRAQQAWSTPPERLAIDVADALNRAGNRINPQVKEQLESQLVGALRRLKPTVPVIDQADESPRLAELVAHVWGTTAVSAAAPEEMWNDVAFPLLFIGAPSSFPPLDDDHQNALKQGADPLLIYLDAVPYQHANPSDGGLLGVFSAASVRPAHAKLGHAVRLIGVDASVLVPPVRAFDATASADALRRFREHVKSAMPGTNVATSPEAEAMAEVGMKLVASLKQVVDAPGDRFIRRITEAEAMSEAALGQLRTALQAPRIILA